MSVQSFRPQAIREGPSGTHAWAPAHVAAIARTSLPEIPLLEAGDVQAVIPGLFLWDIWPVQLDTGPVADVQGGSLWIVLSAPRGPDPDQRHDAARMRLLFRKAGRWHDCGNLLPDSFSPGSREWSGSARLDPVSGQVTLWFTAAGRRGETGMSFLQRLFQATGTVDLSGAMPAIINWQNLAPSVLNDGTYYADLAVTQGVPGRIKGFRDPYWFRDPADGIGYLLFTGSKPAAQAQSDYDGVIGLARASDDKGLASFSLLPPLVDGDTLVNELELPHMLVIDGLYYLFWSSQRSVFAPSGPVGPTGLYGMVGKSVRGPFRPLNGTGLVLTNPAAEPRQNYAWKVLPTLDVISFVDYWGLKGRDPVSDPALKSAHFGGTIAPFVKIAVQDDRTWIESAT